CARPRARAPPGGARGRGEVVGARLRARPRTPHRGRCAPGARRRKRRPRARGVVERCRRDRRDRAQRGPGPAPHPRGRVPRLVGRSPPMIRAYRAELARLLRRRMLIGAALVVFVTAIAGAAIVLSAAEPAARVSSEGYPPTIAS